MEQASDSSDSGYCLTSGHCSCFKTPTIECNSCSKRFCQNCLVSSHTLVDILQHKIVNKERDVLTCSKHDEQFKRFCVDHCKLCCIDCISEDHKDCKEIYNFKKGLETVTKQLQVKADQLNQQYEDRKTKCLSQSKAIPDEIKLLKTEVLKKFEEFEAKCDQDMKTFNDSNKQETALNMRDCSAIIGDIKSVKPILDAIGDISSRGGGLLHTVEKIKMYKSCLEEKAANNYTVEFKLTFDSAVKGLEDEVCLGKLKITKCFDDRPIRLRIEQETDLKKFRGDAGEPLFASMSYFNGGNLVAVDSMNCSCLVFNEKLDVVANHKFSTIPYSVATLDENKFAVSSQDGLETYSISKTNSITALHAYEVHPFTSLCLVKKGLLCGTAIDDQRFVRKITTSGKEQDFHSSLPERKYKYGECDSSFIVERDFAVISEKYKNRLLLYDMGKAIAEQSVVSHESIKSPRGIAVGPSDCILVCCEGTNCIAHISLTKQVKTLEVEMTQPTTIAIDTKKRKIAVSNNVKSGRKLQTYILEF